MNKSTGKIAVVVFCLILLIVSGCEKKVSVKETAEPKSPPLPTSFKNELEHATPVVIRFNKPIPPNQAPMMHLWRKPETRQHACSVKNNTNALLLAEKTVKGTRYAKLKTEKCVGYMKADYVVKKEN